MALLEEVNVTTGSNGTEAHLYNARLGLHSHADFRAWLFGQPHSVNKDKILELTLFAFPPEEKNYNYYQMEIKDEDFKALLAKDLKSIPDFFYTTSWYSYAHEGHFYVDFAHPHVFGGSFRSWGNVQEEMMFFECPKLAHLAFATQETPIECCIGNPPKGNPRPFLLKDVQRLIKISSELYGDGLESVTENEINGSVEYLPRPQRINVIGMAAIAWLKQNPRYQMEDLLFLLKTAFLAFDGAKLLENGPVIHTGAWGCGTFKNSLKMITAIQMLAGCMAEVELIFEGLDAELFFVESLMHEAKTIISSHKTPINVLEDLLSRQELDPGYRPK